MTSFQGAPGLGLWGPLAIIVVVALACQGGGAAPATAPTASPTQATISSTPTPVQTRHRVNEGDTLLAIARRYGVPVEAIARANGLKEPYLLQVGQELVIPEATEETSPTPSPTPRPSANPAPIREAATVIPPSPTSATPTPTPQPRDATAPYAIQIPAIGVSAEMVPVGKAPDGTMATPENPYAVGWYGAGPRPGSPQNVLLAGHLDWVDALGRVRAGVFWRLRELRPGNEVILEDGPRRYRYLVQETIKIRYDDPQALDLLQFGRGALVTMITCEGPEFDPVARNYLWRRIVVAALQPD